MFIKAERRKAKLRLAITGPAGSGKTYGALLVAMGLGGRIALIDTENGSGNLYSSLGEYYVEPIEAPYTVEKYLSAIHGAEQAGFNVLIIDSLSHAWAGEGGLLERKDKIAQTDRTVNGYTAWGRVTPLHNKLVEAILSSRCHIIATMRSKTEYVLVENDRGKKEPRKVGLAPVQRDGVEYEFGTVFDLGADHTASVSKDRTSIFDGQVFALSKEVGAKLKDWLESGADVPVLRSISSSAQPDRALEARKQELYKGYMEVCNGVKEHAQNAMLKALNGKGWRDWTSEDLKVLADDLDRRRRTLCPPSATAQSSPSSVPEVPVTATDEIPTDSGIKFDVVEVIKPNEVHDPAVA